MSLYSDRCAALKLHIAVVGGGLGGLAVAFTLAKAGHRVTILESASILSEVGAGIHIAPNASRLLMRWGLGPALNTLAVRPQAAVFRRYNTGDVIRQSPWHDVEQRYGAPFFHIHRADLQGLLSELVADAPSITLRLNATVTHLEPAAPDGPCLTLANGEVIQADLVVGADGIKSIVRQVVVGGPDMPTPTGDAAYRAVIPTVQIAEDPELRWLIDTPEMTGWVAPGYRVITYCVRAKRELNLMLVHPDDGAVESWTAEGSADRMRADFVGFEPRVQKLLALVPSTFRWKLMDRQPLETWIHPAGRVVLLGDACHPMLPYRGQGVAMAFEDAAILGGLFVHIAHPAQIFPLLRAYEALRLPRTAATQGVSRFNQKVYHLPDGPEQEARDAEMRAAMRVQPEQACEGGTTPNQWADRRKDDMQFGYDADAEVNRWWTEVGERDVGALAEGATKV